MVERNAAYWLKKAEEARHWASQMHPEARNTMLDLAQNYDLMAQRAEGREVRSGTTATKPHGSD